MEHTPNGILLVDKAEGWTSHDVVAKARRALGTRKVGHAGTLDPMATGLLLLGAGPSTRLLTHLVGLDKTYTATIRLGQATVTDDREGDLLTWSDEEQAAVSRRIAALAADADPIRRAATELTGAIEQAPSAVSAIKVDGRRAYDRVREGEHVELKRRPVTVHEFRLGDPVEARATEQPVIDIPATVRCSSGTYVRALARDLGAALGVGGHLTTLRRTAVGPFGVDEAVPNAALSDADPGSLALLEPAAVAGRLFPVLRLNAAQAIDLGHGKKLALDPDTTPDSDLVAALGPQGGLIGLASVERGRVRVVTNFPQGSASVSSPVDGNGGRP